MLAGIISLNSQHDANSHLSQPIQAVIDIAPSQVSIAQANNKCDENLFAFTRNLCGIWESHLAKSFTYCCPICLSQAQLHSARLGRFEAHRVVVCIFVWIIRQILSL